MLFIFRPTAMFMLFLCNNNLNELLNLPCMHNGKLVVLTHCDECRQFAMPVRVTEMESNVIGLIIYQC